ncbi:thiamine pyrophosphate-dependent enzyme [Actinomadura madurae]|uniref:thiamine pyrophosphate-dependent enzyme n=1 Tax=Actinomadura madurae TaxID=1993 RepID=UPI0020D239DE|nr:thiamine pyrophosphate-dependent enzyme [Actinomadura madurae]MCP9948908.1 thiamine pyrophosphate-dependent enzyme [Actinomadura madurae]
MLREVADALNEAANPVVIVGAGVDDEGALPGVVSLAERIGAPVWISPLSGRSGFPEDHALFRGFLPPVREQLWRRLEGHDVILALGTPIFTYHVHSEGRFIPDGSRLFHLDCDPAQAAWAPVGTSVLTTIDAGVSGLLDLVEKADRPLPEPRVALAKPQAADPIDPAFVVETLKERLPEDAVIVEEVPSYREMLHARLPITRSGGFLTTGSGALGWGLPVAVGRALTGSGERVVCVIGDGSIMYSVQGLWTAAQHRVPMTVIVLNNQGYGAVKALGRRIDLETVPGTDLPGIDFVAVAGGLGCPGRTVTTAAELDAAMAEGLGHDGPFIIDVRVTPDDAAAYQPEAD